MEFARGIFRETRLLIGSRFASQVVVVAGGTAAAQAITVAFSPFVTRLYGPEAYGILGIFAAMTALLAPVATLALAAAVVLPVSERDARALARLSITASASVALVLVFVFIVLRAEIASAFGFAAPAAYLLLIPAVVFLSGVEQTWRQWLVRKQRFRTISGAGIARAVLVGSSKVGIGTLLPTAPVLLILNTLGHGVHATLLWIGSRRSPVQTGCGGDRRRASVARTELRDIIRRYRDFPLYRAPQQLLNAGSHSLAPLLLAAFFGPVPAGFYALSRSALGLPLTLVSSSVGTVLLPRLARTAQRGQKLRSVLLKTTLGLVLIGIMPFGAVVAFGPWLFGFVFGGEWVVAGQYSQWLALMLLVQFASTPCMQAVAILDLQRHFLRLEVIAVTLRVAGLVWGAIVMQSSIAAVALFAIAGAVFQVLRILWILGRSDGPVRTSLQPSSDIDRDSGLED